MVKLFLLTLLAFGATLGYGASLDPEPVDWAEDDPYGDCLETAEKRMYRLRHDLVMTNVMCEGHIMYLSKNQ